MKIRDFLKAIKEKGYTKINGYGNGYNFIKAYDRFFISNYEIHCIYDITSFSMKDFNINQEAQKW